jgi:hypothetical protein
MKITFSTPTTRRSPGLLAEVEIQFEVEPGFEGLKLVGFALWRKPRSSDLYVTLPSRAYDTDVRERPGGRSKTRKYFDYLRSSREVYADTDAIRQRIIDAWKER